MASCAPADTASAPESVFEPPPAGILVRSFAAYCRLLALDPRRLRRGPVLEVGAGLSSFTAEACRAGIDAVAVDPRYGSRPEELEAQVERHHQQLQRRLGRAAGRAAREAAERDHRATARRFLEDYRAHFAHGRYFGASLPLLPFFDGTFDVVLCVHLLFAPVAKFDYAFQLAACRELVRVSREEVRIHPAPDAAGKRDPDLPRLVEALAQDGVMAEWRSVDGEFLSDSDSILILRRQP